MVDSRSARVRENGPRSTYYNSRWIGIGTEWEKCGNEENGKFGWANKNTDRSTESNSEINYRGVKCEDNFYYYWKFFAENRCTTSCKPTLKKVSHDYTSTQQNMHGYNEKQSEIRKLALKSDKQMNASLFPSFIRICGLLEAVCFYKR